MSHVEYGYGIDLVEVMERDDEVRRSGDGQDYCDGCPVQGGTQCPPDCPGLDMVNHEPCPF